MRLLEMLMLLAILPVLVWPLLPWPRPRWVDFLPGAALVMMILQLLLEGYRWQMLPAYALVVVIFLATLSRLRYPKETAKVWSGWMIAGSIAGLLLWALALALPYVLPVSQLPATTGRYDVGTRIFYLIDENREEIYTADPNDKRELMMQVWYPAQPGAEGEDALYLEDLRVMGPVLAERLGLPPFLLQHINLVDLRIKKDVPLRSADGPYPLLLFSHGLRGIRQQNTALVRELVSQGFVVAAVDHVYGGAITVYPDGRVALYTDEVFSGEGDPPHTGTTLVGEWARDAASVLDILTLWNGEPDHPFYKALDLAAVGAFGHSTGGGAAVTFCGIDERCRAAVGLDAWVAPVAASIINAGLEQPLLLLQAGRWFAPDGGENERTVERLFANQRGRGYLALVEGASHFDFTDVPMLSPLAKYLGLSSGRDSDYLAAMMADIVGAFWRQELRGEEEDLASEAGKYREMTLEAK